MVPSHTTCKIERGLQGPAPLCPYLLPPLPTLLASLLVPRWLRRPPASACVHWTGFPWIAPRATSTFLGLWANVPLLDNSSFFTLYEVVSPFIFSTCYHLEALYIYLFTYVFAVLTLECELLRKGTLHCSLLYPSYLVHSWCSLSICWMNEWFVECVQSFLRRPDGIIQLPTFKCPRDVDRGWCISTSKNWSSVL